MSNMGGKSEQGNFLKSMPITSSESNDKGTCSTNAKEANDDPPRDYSKQLVFEAERNENYPIAQPIYAPWVCSKQTAYNHVIPVPTIPAVIPDGTFARDIPQDVPVNSLQTRPTLIHSYNARDVLEGVPVPLRSIKDVREVSELQQGLSLNSIGNKLDPIDSYHDMNVLDVKPSIHIPNRNNGKAPVNLSRVLQSDQNEIFEGETSYAAFAQVQVSHLSSHGEGHSLNKLVSNGHQILSQSYASTTQESNEEIPNIWKTPTVTVAVPGFRSRQGVPSKSCIANRLRRARISERLKLLAELLPHSEEGNKESLMDDIIDYIKFLQLQIKTLSQGTLGGEATEDPFINLEGFGHYLLNQETLTEPFEEVIGQLMKVNKPAFTQLLESKGLSVMPMALAGVCSKPRRGLTAQLT